MNVELLKDLRLLTELHDLTRTRVIEYLEARLDDAVIEAREATTDRQATIAIGKQRELNELLKVIRTAGDRLVAIQDERKQPPIEMSKSY